LPREGFFFRRNESIFLANFIVYSMETIPWCKLESETFFILSSPPTCNVFVFSFFVLYWSRFGCCHSQTKVFFCEVVFNMLFVMSWVCLLLKCAIFQNNLLDIGFLFLIFVTLIFLLMFFSFIVIIFFVIILYLLSFASYFICFLVLYCIDLVLGVVTDKLS